MGAVGCLGKAMNEITFYGSIAKVQTLVDGGIRVTLDLPETATLQMAQLAECQRSGLALEITARLVESKESGEGSFRWWSENEEL